MASKTYRFDVEVKGYVTVEVKAPYHAAALRKVDAWCDKNLLGTQVKDLSSKSCEYNLLTVDGEDHD